MTGLDCEHGLSLYIEANETKLLFDTGQSNLFSINAKALGIDLSLVDIAVISHGHYDHGGGISEFLEINKKAPVYISRYAFEPHYNGTEKYIGLDTELRNNSRIILTDGSTELGNGMTLYAVHDMKKLVDFGSAGLNMIQNGKMQSDDFRHELALHTDGLLFTGCAHSGLENILAACPWPVNTVVGGFHLLDGHETRNDLVGLAQRLADNYPQTVFHTSHCTGDIVFGILEKVMADRLHAFCCGTTCD